MSSLTTRRALVLTSEAAHHPFRQTLPPHVLALSDEARPPRSLREVATQDWRSLLATYCATFVAVSLYVA